MYSCLLKTLPHPIQTIFPSLAWYLLINTLVAMWQSTTLLYIIRISLVTYVDNSAKVIYITLHYITLPISLCLLNFPIIHVSNGCSNLVKTIADVVGYCWRERMGGGGWSSMDKRHGPFDIGSFSLFERKNPSGIPNILPWSLTPVRPTKQLVVINHTQEAKKFLNL